MKKKKNRKIRLSTIFIIIAVLLASYPLFLGNLINQVFFVNKNPDFQEFKKNPNVVSDDVVEDYNQNITADTFNKSGLDVFEETYQNKSGESYSDQFDLDVIRGYKGFEKVIGMVRIPKIKEDVLLFYGATDHNLERGAAIVENTSMPSHDEKGVYTVLAGHRGMMNLNVFKNVHKLDKGDELIIELNGEEYKYKLRDTVITTPDRSDLLQFDENKNQLAIVTCYPYLVNNKRMLLFFDKV